jgi:hypothetical protein
MAKIITENFRVETTKEMFSTFTSQNETIEANFLTGLDTYVANTSGVSLTVQQKSDIQDIVEGQLSANLPVASYYIVGSSVDKTNSISNTQFEKREFQRRVIFGNKVTDENIRYMFHKNTWAINTVYDDFDDTQDISLLNNTVTIASSSGDYEVYKCIENGKNITFPNGRPSLIAPNKTDIDPTTYEQIFASDGYVWKYLFTVPQGDELVFGTSDSLPLPYPSYGDPSVIAAAKENISQIIIEDTRTNLFSDYRFGPCATNQDASQVEFTSSVSASGNTSNVVVKAATASGNAIKSGWLLKDGANFYKNMYLRAKFNTTYNYNVVENGAAVAKSINQGTVFLYNVIASTTSTSSLDMSITIDGIESSFANDTNFWDATELSIVPKIKISRSTSTGTPAIAYGNIDKFGTLDSISFFTKGSEYKYASAELILPSALTGLYTSTEAADLRCVISPKGGHGSDMINELGMSRLAINTNFSGEDVAIPNSNTYTKVGLIKNPIFTDGIFPTQIDNRTSIVINGSNVTATAVAGRYVRQVKVLDSNTTEVVTGKIHESVYDGSNTTIYLVDYYGNFQSTFETGLIYISTDLTTSATEGESISINNTDVTYGKYSPYSGEVLHFVDFDPIQRQAARKEKIKFIFDF